MMSWKTMLPRERDTLVESKLIGRRVEKVAKAWTHADWMASDEPTELDCYAIINPTFKSGDLVPPALCIPRYTTSWEDVQIVTDTISLLDLWKKYTLSLADITRATIVDCRGVYTVYLAGVFRMLIAQPADQCLAALRAVGVDI